MSRRSFLYRAGGILLGLLGLRNRQLHATHALQATKLTILHTNDIHGHLTAWSGWDGDLKDKTIGGLGRLASAIIVARAEADEGGQLYRTCQQPHREQESQAVCYTVHH